MRTHIGPVFTEVVGPNNDTLYSLAWLDLGTEPVVLILPDFPDERYYMIQIVDMYTFNVEYIGARTTDYQAAKYLFAGPGWDGPTPEGIDGVRRREGRYLLLLGRTAIAGAEDVPAVKALQDQFDLASIGFIDYFSFLLGQFDPGQDELPLLKKWAKIGVQSGETFDPEDLAPEIRQVVAVGDQESITTEPIQPIKKDKGEKMSGNNHTIELNNQEIENIVRRSYQYVAMYNVNNKFALTQGGWNTVKADTQLKDHTLTDIARPNNDTLYIGCMLDLRADAIIMDIPAFDSKYVSFMVTAYDHYVTIPMASRVGDFKKPEKVLFYSARTDGYRGEPVEGVDRVYETSGDFVSAVFRVMPHANEPERFKKIVAQMQSVKLITLSEFQGKPPKPVDEPQSPQVGKTDADVFANNFLEVMQFVFNHVSLDPADELDQAVMAALKPLGVEPGKSYDPSQVAKLDGSRFRKVVEKMLPVETAKATDPEWSAQNGVGLFQPKGKMTLERLVLQSIIGPIGQPAFEAVYPAVATTDGAPMNAMHDYVLRMKGDQMPPAMAFWSATLYDTKNGFFIPNDRKKYSVGENGGMKLDADGGIAIYIAAEQPAGAPEENWLPINRGDYGIDVIMRLYAPDLQRYQNWKAPKAEKIS